MSTLCVRLFGKLHISRADQSVDGFTLRKVQELFCYLVLYHDHPYPRETLAGRLWGDLPDMQARRCLRQTLWQLQTALRVPAGCDTPTLRTVDADHVQIRLHEHCWLDVADFERCAARVQGQPGECFTPTLAHEVRAAVDLYQGDLLEGWYQDWCLYERERLQNTYLLLLDKLMAYCETSQEYEAGIDYGARILRYDRASERTHCRLMRLYSLMGDRAGALRQYHRCAAALDQELGVEPAAHTQALYAQIKTDRLHTIPPTDYVVPDVVDLPVPTSRVLVRVRQIWQTIAELEHDLRREVQALEQALPDRGEPLVHK